jgi:hypothetical protein
MQLYIFFEYFDPLEFDKIAKKEEILRFLDSKRLLIQKYMKIRLHKIL